VARCVLYGMMSTLRVPLFGFGRRGISTGSCRGLTGDVWRVALQGGPTKATQTVLKLTAQSTPSSLGAKRRGDLTTITGDRLHNPSVHQCHHIIPDTHRLFCVDVLLDIPFRTYYSPLTNSDLDGRFNRDAMSMCGTPSFHGFGYVVMTYTTVL
jgi:hypothetical protein